MIFNKKYMYYILDFFNQVLKISQPFMFIDYNQWNLHHQFLFLSNTDTL